MQIMPLVNRGDAKTMKIAVWVVFSVLTLLWTIGIFIAVKLTQWGTNLLVNGNIDPLSRGVADWPLPEGMPEWVDPSMIQTLQQFALFEFYFAQ